MEKVSGTLSNVPAIANYESGRNATQVEQLQKTIDGLIDGNEVAY